MSATVTERGESVAKVPEEVTAQEGKSHEGSSPGAAPRSVTAAPVRSED